MASYQEETIEDRLAKRRRLRNQRFLKRNTTEETELAIRRSIAPIAKTSGLPPIERSHSKQTDSPLHHRTSLPAQVIERQYLSNDKQTSMRSLMTYERIPEKPVAIKETALSTTDKNFPPISRETRGYSTPNQVQPFEEHPSLHSTHLTRAASEQIVSMTPKYKHRSVGSIFANQNSLALSYLFNQRLIDTELARIPSPDSKQSRRRTVWD